MRWTGVDLVAASALATALFGALVLLAIPARARADVLASPVGWLRHTAGPLAALLLPVGLSFLSRSSSADEVTTDAG
jgi:predicted permease